MHFRRHPVKDVLVEPFRKESRFIRVCQPAGHVEFIVDVTHRIFFRKQLLTEVPKHELAGFAGGHLGLEFGGKHDGRHLVRSRRCRVGGSRRERDAGADDGGGLVVGVILGRDDGGLGVGREAEREADDDEQGADGFHGRVFGFTTLA